MNLLFFLLLLCYSDTDTVVGLPRPIHESIKTLKQVWLCTSLCCLGYFLLPAVYQQTLDTLKRSSQIELWSFRSTSTSPSRRYRWPRRRSFRRPLCLEWVETSYLNTARLLCENVAVCVQIKCCRYGVSARYCGRRLSRVRKVRHFVPSPSSGWRGGGDVLHRAPLPGDSAQFASVYGLYCFFFYVVVFRVKVTTQAEDVKSLMIGFGSLRPSKANFG